VLPYPVVPYGEAVDGPYSPEGLLYIPTVDVEPYGPTGAPGRVDVCACNVGPTLAPIGSAAAATAAVELVAEAAEAPPCSQGFGGDAIRLSDTVGNE